MTFDLQDKLVSAMAVRVCCRGNRLALHLLSRSVSHSSVSMESVDELDSHTRALFSRSAIGTFFQERPLLTNPFTQDALLRAYLRRHLPEQEVERDLLRFGERLVAEIDALGRQCELKPPVLQHYDAWGRRVDRILTCDAWTRLKRISAQEGLVAAGYERTYGDWSRVYQMSKMYLFAPSAGLYTCPLAMTDGAAKVIESLGVPVREAFERLTTRDEKRFWTSGQWMTERRGGSDVSSGTETVARRQQDGWFKLYGFKWFTSATDADMTLTLARITDQHGRSTAGSSGLSLFLAEVWDADGSSNGVEVQRLKDKLGTRQVPTAELLLDGTNAQLLSEEGRGVASIANMLTITRIYNAVCAVGAMRRISHLCREYACKRSAFGKLLKDHALHVQTLSRLEVETRAAFLLTMEVCRLLGREENRSASDRDTLLLRLLTPVAKLYTAKQAVCVVSEGLESFGGQGYIEDTGLPSMLRDAQVSVCDLHLRFIRSDELPVGQICFSPTDGSTRTTLTRTHSRVNATAVIDLPQPRVRRERMAALKAEHTQTRLNLDQNENEKIPCFAVLDQEIRRTLELVLQGNAKSVLSIWEGTTNVLSLDVLRSIAKSSGSVLRAFFTDVNERLLAADASAALRPAVASLCASLSGLERFTRAAASRPAGTLELSARDLSYSLARIYMGALLVDHAAWEKATHTDVYAALRWCEQDLCPVVSGDSVGCYDPQTAAMDTALVYDGLKP
ncbi:Acyl-CoA dehydrogenase family member 11 [Labeo rohita]|uniref:Acyl-CoA dehydrogenase family member 11 n=1 Tax=Labeo rohita TaxID=84645 RepID=A0ABQ8N1D4_LABRO|nr:Acyl-CoA dehydrogenase family member 11 [Labeo rohita]